MSRKTRRYDDEFKKNTVSLYLTRGKSYPVLSEELGIPASTLTGWVNSGKYHSQGSSKRKITEAELSELKQLRKELIRVRAERDILKKAVAIFAKPQKGKGLNS